MRRDCCSSWANSDVAEAARHFSCHCPHQCPATTLCTPFTGTLPALHLKPGNVICMPLPGHAACPLGDGGCCCYSPQSAARGAWDSCPGHGHLPGHPQPWCYGSDGSAPHPNQGHANMQAIINPHGSTECAKPRLKALLQTRYKPIIVSHLPLPE
jgi:hypothetical protein